jgi:hypothetical protein
VRVAVATSRDVASVAHDPYVRTLWTHEHLSQRDYFDGLRKRGDQINQASLLALGFHEPKKLGDESRKLMASAGLVKIASPDEARALIAEMKLLDATGAWK